MIAEQDIQLLYDILNLTHAGNHEAKMMERFIGLYIDPSVTHICPHCSYQIRQAHKRVVEWWSRNKSELETWKQCSCGEYFYASHHKTTKCPTCKTN